MAVTVTITAPLDGEVIGMPYEVRGTATPSPAARSVALMAWQLDGGPLRDLAFTPAGAGNPVNYTFTLMEEDCPNVDTWYSLAVYAWDDGTPAACGPASVSFLRGSGSRM